MSGLAKMLWIVTFGIVALVTVTGNSLFLVVFHKSQRIRRMRTSLLLVNLAAADLIVGTVAIPMYIAVLWPGGESANSEALRWAYDVIDVLSGFASLFGLVVIALERVYSVFRPHKHRALTTAPYLAAVFTSWLVAALQLILKSLERGSATSWRVALYSIFLLLTSVVITIIAAYSAVWIKMKRQAISSSHQRKTLQEKKLVNTLAIVTGIFLVTWLPFHVVNMTYNLCVRCQGNMPLNLVCATKLLHYSNSLVNPVVYSFRFPEVRRTLRKIFGQRKQIVARMPFRMAIRRKGGGEGAGNVSLQPVQSTGRRFSEGNSTKIKRHVV